MDSNVLIAGIFGIVGTLVGAIVGAWLNPLMQEWRERRKLKQFIKGCNEIEKFILLNAYRTIFVPIYEVKILNIGEFNNDDVFALNDLMAFCEVLSTIICKFKEEEKIFAILKEVGYHKGYIISLHSNIKNLISSNQQIRDELIKAAKKIIANKIYPHYNLMLKDTIFSKIDKNILDKYVSFMNNIGVFDVYNQDLSHLKFDNPKSYLAFPKREFHPEFYGR